MFTTRTISLHHSGNETLFRFEIASCLNLECVGPNGLITVTSRQISSNPTYHSIIFFFSSTSEFLLPGLAERRSFGAARSFAARIAPVTVGRCFVVVVVAAVVVFLLFVVVVPAAVCFESPEALDCQSVIGYLRGK